MIRTCLFDLGNVLVFFSHDLMCQQIAELFQVPVDQVKQTLFASEGLVKFEKGQISEAEFHRELEQIFAREVAFDGLRRAASDIFTVNSDILPVIDALKEQGTRLVLLSNTCVSHIDHVRAQFDVLERFDDFILSYEVGSLKPEPEIFEHALAAIGCPPEDCFYTDDIAENIEAGRTFGLQASLFTTVAKLKTDLQDLGVKA